MEAPSTTPLPSPMSYTVAPPASETAAPSEISDACMQMALGKMCEARYHRQMESLHSTAPWYGTVYAVLVVTFYVVFCLVLLLRSRTSLSYSARGNLQVGNLQPEAAHQKGQRRRPQRFSSRVECMVNPSFLLSRSSTLFLDRSYLCFCLETSRKRV